MKGRLAMGRTMLVVALALCAAPLSAHGQVGQGRGRGTGGGVAEGVQAGMDGWLGVALSCDNCTLRRSRSEPGRWTFRTPPGIFWVDPDGPAYRAGLRRGDTLISIDGQDLTGEDGGRAFARVVPGQHLRLGYRRDGHEREARLTAIERPESAAETAASERVRQMREDQQQQMERAREYSRMQVESLRTYQDQQRQQMEQARERLSLAARDLERLNSRSRSIDSAAAQAARRRVIEAESTLAALQAQYGMASRAYAFAPARPPRPSGKFFPGIIPVPPAAPPAPAAPVPPVPPVPPFAVAPPVPALAPMAPAPPYAVFSGAGGIRYSGRLGDAIVEARAHGPVNTTEVGDSEVIVSAGDLSVRVALRPIGNRFSFSFSTPAPTAAGVVWTAEGDAVYGATTYPINPDLGRTFGATTGVLVLEVSPRSHADSLGILAGDVLLEVNGNPVASSPSARGPATRRPGAVRVGPRANPPGAQNVTVMRGGERRALRLSVPATTITPRPRRP